MCTTPMSEMRGPHGGSLNSNTILKQIFLTKKTLKKALEENEKKKEK